MMSVERMIQTVNRSLLIVLVSRKLTLAVLRAVVAEADAILNSGPLTHVGCSILGEGPLTPNHFSLCRPHMRLKSLVNNLPAVLRERLQVNAGTT